MTDIEELLRESFAAQVADQPALHAPADRAIRTGRAVRRRRTLFGLLGSVVAVLVAGAGVATVPASRPAPRPLPSPAPSVAVPANRLALTMLVPRTGLVLADGRTVDLTAYSPVDAYAMSGGWLVLGQNNQSSLLLVTPDGAVHVLLRGAGDVVPAADGRHLAWVADGQLRLGHLDGVSIVVDHATAAPTEGIPVAVTGSAVVIGGTTTGKHYDRLDVWVPASGGYVAHWDRTPANVTWVLGAAPDGHSLLGTVLGPAGGTQVCLALLDPTRHLAVTRTACRFDYMGAFARMSPDGRWLAMDYLGTDNVMGTALVDLSTVFDQPRIVRQWPYPLGYWLDATTMVTRSGTGPAVRLRVGQDAAEPTDIPVLSGGSDYTWVPPPTGSTRPLG